MNKYKKIGKHTLSFVLLYFAVLMIRSTDWAIYTFNSIEFTEIIYHLKVPIAGTSSTILTSFFIDAALFSLVVTLVIYMLLLYSYKRFQGVKLISFIKQRQVITMTVAFVIFGCFALIRVNALDYVAAITKQSTFIEENYVDGRDIKITFPEDARNLIYIFLESMESTYLSEEIGGQMENNLLPNLSSLAQKHVNFSNDDKLGGFYSVQNTNWTVAAMVGQTMGLPLSVPINSNAYYGNKPFLPGAYSIGDILEREGYNQELLIGSKAEFGARNLLFSQHGNYKINDYHAAINEQRLPSGYFEWWGYEDTKLFDFAKEELLELSSKEDPFNLTMLTVNTHFQDGYLEETCEVQYDDKYYNVISCADDQVNEFITWIQQQEFYKDTTVVVVGDHLTMNKKTFDHIDESDRTVFNLFVNSVPDSDNTKMRTATTFDMYPTTLASMGVEIEGNQLGLGVNLFSEERTLAEEHGLDKINEEIQYYSEFYTDELLRETIDE